MSFSLRLTADLTFAWAARAVGAQRDKLFLQSFTTVNIFDSVSEAVAVRDSSVMQSPVVWIGGPDPMDYPEAASFANSIATSSRHVFLETSGASLKPRLHEFKPSSNFYFVVRFESGPASRIGLEALRMARLGGFFTCARIVARHGAASSEPEELHREISKLDVDGILITAADASPEARKQAAVLRRRLLSLPCAFLSSVLDANASAAPVRDSAKASRTPVPESQNESLSERAEAR